jgi:tetratricopeptide (TPR) repeat protein
MLMLLMGCVCAGQSARGFEEEEDRWWEDHGPPMSPFATFTPRHGLTDADGSTAMFNAPERSATLRPADAVVSATELRHKPSKRAKRAMADAEKLLKTGDHERIAEALRKAVLLDPDGAALRGNLGAEYLFLHQHEEAAAELGRAAALDPAAAWIQSNLAYALMKLHRLEEAEKWARHAVALDRGNGKCRYLLGCVLLSRPETRSEGIQQLQRSAQAYPPAHLELARAYVAAGEPALASRELQQYRAADSAAKVGAQGWTAAFH